MTTKGLEKNRSHTQYLPTYKGLKWLDIELPLNSQPWLSGRQRSVAKERGQRSSTEELLREVVQRGKWQWPKQKLYFITDLHADADAFIASLVASGGVRKTGEKQSTLKLTSDGKKAIFVIGGDCFDKGPSNLTLLRSIRQLTQLGAKVVLLAGNHDLRIKLGIASVGMEPDPSHDHFFIRMGSKVIPMLREIVDEYLQEENALRGVPSTRTCRRILYPPKSWFKEFPKIASWVMPEKRMAKELKRLKEKIDDFESGCEAVGLSLRHVYAAVMKWQQLFLEPGGEFSWFFKQMKLVYRQGSFLFVHAGIDDRMAKLIKRKGIKYINKEFRDSVKDEIFEFYYGPMANLIRTKYRDVDMPLTRKGVDLMHDAGIHTIVHGHANRYYGQRIMLRKGMIHFECDASVDRNTRIKERLKGKGAAVTIFHPKKLVMGVSTDYPHIKVFDQKSFE